MPVHAGQLEFELEIRDRPQAAQDDLAGIGSRAFHQQRIEAQNLDLRNSPHRLASQRHALLQAEERTLVAILGDRYHHPLEHARRPADQIDVAIGNGVERAGIDGGDAHATVREMR